MDAFPIIKLESVNSTNTYLKNLIKKGTLLRGAVFSLTQTKGRGRGNNRWVSPKGGIYISIAFPIQNPNILKLIGPYASLEIVEWLKTKFNIEAKIKWPNDILVNNRKLAGFLIEIITIKDMFIPIIGFGMNLNVAPEITEQNAFKSICIKDLINKRSNIEAIANEVITKLSSSEKINLHLKNELLQKIKKHNTTLGKQVKILMTDSSTIIGKAIDIGEDFHLKVEYNGIIQEIKAGDCYHILKSTDQGE